MTTDIVPLTDADRPGLVLAKATEQAELLVKVVEKQKLYVDIKGRRHVQLEGWTFLGSMRGVFPIVVWTKPIEGGWEARVEARTISGNVVGAAEAQCTNKEPNWSDRDDYALRSMAQTRAASKALRLPLGYIMVLAGFEATPAEEMPSEAKQPKTSEHWCEEHQTNWFKRGRMKGYAHPIEGTGEWCNEPEASTSPLVQEAQRLGATVEDEQELCPTCGAPLRYYATSNTPDKGPRYAHKLPNGTWHRFTPMEYTELKNRQEAQEEEIEEPDALD